ncbi:sigma-70 family RNA polymerase sigma factor [Robertmurraya sp. Marseille-Q9965]
MSSNSKPKEESLEKLEKFYHGLQQYCRFIARNQWDGDDLAQESFLRAVQRYPESDISPALLKKIAYHYWIDTLRKKKDECNGMPFEMLSVEKQISPEEVMSTVQKLMKLTPKQAVTFLLKEGFSFRSKEIAELLNTTEMAVKATLHRARRRLDNDDSFSMEDTWTEEGDHQLLSHLMYQSLQEEDPKVLIDRLSEIFSKTPGTPLNMYSMAA